MQAVEDLHEEVGSLVFWHLLEILNVLYPEMAHSSTQTRHLGRCIWCSSRIGAVEKPAEVSHSSKSVHQSNMHRLIATPDQPSVYTVWTYAHL